MAVDEPDSDSDENMDDSDDSDNAIAPTENAPKRAKISAQYTHLLARIDRHRETLGEFSIGFASRGFPTNGVFPGSLPLSYGYHSAGSCYGTFVHLI